MQTQLGTDLCGQGDRHVAFAGGFSGGYAGGCLDGEAWVAIPFVRWSRTLTSSGIALFVWPYLFAAGIQVSTGGANTEVCHLNPFEFSLPGCVSICSLSRVFHSAAALRGAMINNLTD